MKFVDGIENAWKWFSVQAMALAGALQLVWIGLPDDLKASVPRNLITYITVALLALGVCGRLVQQVPPK